MPPFFIMRWVWIFVSLYHRYILKIKHPVESPVLFDTKSELIKILLIPTLWDNYSYLVISGNEVVIVDPSDFKAISKEITKRKLSVKAILLTHEHIDHVLGVLELSRKYNVKVITSKDSYIPGKNIEIEDGFEYCINEVKIKAIYVPGHNASPYPISAMNKNVAWHIESAGVLFPGDTIFSCGYGCIEEGTDIHIFNSLKKIRELPADTVMFYGHEYSIFCTPFAYSIDSDSNIILKRLDTIKELLKSHKPTIPTTLNEERQMNPFLRWDDQKLKSKLCISHLSDFDTFCHFRKIKHDYHQKN